MDMHARDMGELSDFSCEKEIKHWLRHIATVPKGYCRFLIMKILAESEKAMSGIEIINKIEELTSAKWKPSPGSIYPSLKWLEEKGVIKIHSIEHGEKRYIITEHGKELMREAGKIKKEIMAKLHDQRSLLRDIFHDIEKDEVEDILEELYSLVFIKKEIAGSEVYEILKEAKEKLEKIEKENGRY